jgi:hypothetical protein
MYPEGENKIQHETTAGIAVSTAESLTFCLLILGDSYFNVPT